MTRIGLLSDTHGFLDQNILNHLADVDEIWHAGDFGTITVSDNLASLKPLKGVYGNVDGTELRLIHPLHQRFNCEGIHVWITHIGGYPGHYAPAVKKDIVAHTPDLFITGHSHILKVMRDTSMPQLLHINPGAAGTHGFHHMRTMVRFTIHNKTIADLEVIELGLRGNLKSQSII